MVKLKLPRILIPRLPRLAKIILLSVVGFYLVLVTFLLVVSAATVKPAKNLAATLQSAMTAFQAKNLSETEAQLIKSKDELKIVANRFRWVSWISYVPFLGGYVADVRHGLAAADPGLEAANIVVAAIKPYADILGFSANDANLNIQSAEEKIIFMLQTLDKISPQLDTVNQQLATVSDEVSQIKAKRYPEKYAGKIITLQQSLASTQAALVNVKPLLSLLPQLLGQEKTQRYLLLFQNNAELRPTGGFLTAYAILDAHKGKITPYLSTDIYELDKKFGNRLPAPTPIKKYLPLVYNWHLRDMNLSPDFKTSMMTFYPNYQSVAEVKDVDGIIAMDTQIVVDLLTVLGEVGVADWGSYSAEIVPECNCPQVVYKMEDYATRPTYYIKANRKGMIGPLMHSILLNVMNSPKKLWPQFMEIGLKNIKEKHLLFYFPNDAAMQQAAESFNAAGLIKAYEGDYFHLNDANFAGAKSNLYVEQTVNQEIEISADGSVTKTVTIEYKNPEKADDCNLESGGLCLNGILRDWVRLYVPEGSELVEVLGSDIEPTTSKDLGKTVLEAFIELRPESKTKLIIKYKLPFKTSADNYKMLIQKQPGTKNFNYQVTINDKLQEFILDGDKEIKS